MTDTMTATQTPTYAPGTRSGLISAPPTWPHRRVSTPSSSAGRPRTRANRPALHDVSAGRQIRRRRWPADEPGQPTAWTTYISTPNAEETAKKVTEAGGQVLSPPMQVMEEGSMAVFADQPARRLRCGSRTG